VLADLAVADGALSTYEKLGFVEEEAGRNPIPRPRDSPRRIPARLIERLIVYPDPTDSA
jgi:hypothetical protein